MTDDLDLWQRAFHLHRSGDLPEAVRLYERYVAGQPDTPWGWLNLGIVRANMGDPHAAEACYMRALTYADGYSEKYKIHDNLCRLYLEQGRVDCIAHGRETVRLQPDFADGWVNLGTSLLSGGAYEEAIASFEHAKALGSQAYHAGLLQARRRICAWDGTEELAAFLRENPQSPVPLLTAFALLGTTGPEQKARARAYAANFTAQYYHPPGAKHRVVGRKIRVGYLSADFHGHAVALCLAESIELHDRDRFEIHGFSIGPQADDPVRQRLVRAFDHFHDVSSMSDEAAAAFIFQSGIDILFDLAGYTFRHRASILARRPAPVQIHHLGWPGTMGAPFIDHMIVDPICAPDAEWFTESLLYLDCYQPNDSTKPDPVPVSRASLGLPEEALVLCSMNDSSKLTPRMLNLWCDLLDVAPHVILWMAAGNDLVRGNINAFLARRKLQQRVFFAARRPYLDYLNAVAVADLALDTSPYGGHATTSDLLWAGVPVLTLKGPSFLACVPSSLVNAAGLPDLATNSLGQYWDTACALCWEPSRLRAMKEHLQRQRRALRLFDTKRYVRDLENSLTGLVS